jgi:molecular chaperone DnaK (HSP70)
MEKLGAIGIDIGSKFSTICAVKGGVIEAVLNESSSRNSPTVIGFCDAERLISDAAVQQMGRNHKNTVAFINRFMGLNGDCTEQLNFEKGFITNEVEVIPDNKKIFFKV